MAPAPPEQAAASASLPPRIGSQRWPLSLPAGNWARFASSTASESHIRSEVGSFRVIFRVTLCSSSLRSWPSYPAAIFSSRLCRWHRSARTPARALTAAFLPCTRGDFSTGSRPQCRARPGGMSGSLRQTTAGPGVVPVVVLAAIDDCGECRRAPDRSDVPIRRKRAARTADCALAAGRLPSAPRYACAPRDCPDWCRAGRPPSRCCRHPSGRRRLHSAG